MCRKVLFTGICALLWIAGSARAIEPADPDLIPEARGVLNYLASVYGKKVVSGMASYGGWRPVYEACGKAPAIYSNDAFGWNKPKCGPSYSKVLQGAIDSTRLWWQDKGGIPAMQFHWGKPGDPSGSAWVGGGGGGKVAASSNADRAGQAVDGDLFTSWNGDKQGEQWLAVDLGSEQTVGGVVVAWWKAYAKAFQIQVSSDGRQWKNLFRTDKKSNFHGDSDVIRFDPVKARHVRLVCTQPGTNWGGYTVYELEVFRSIPEVQK